MIEIEFDISNGWRPDLIEEEAFINKALIDAKNIEAYNGSYWPINNIAIMGAFVASGFAGAGDPRNGVRLRDTLNNYYMIVGSQQASADGKGSLYVISSTLARNATIPSLASASGYNGASWDFEQYGDWAIATNYGDPPQIIKDFSAGNFQDMSNIPAGFKAKYVLFNNGHMIWANYYTTADGLVTRGIIWSAFENIDGTDAYTPSITTGAGTELFPELDGPITGIVGLRNQFVIYAERSLVIGQYVGGIAPYEFVRNPYPGIGCYYPKMLVSTGDVNFFWSDTTIYAFDGSGPPVDIGKGISKTVFAELQTGYPEDMSVAFNLTKNIVYWLYPVGYNDTSGKRKKKILAYNWKENKFTYIEPESSEEIRAIFSGIDLTDITVDSISQSVDTMTQYVDSSTWSTISEMPAIAVSSNYFSTSGWELGFMKDGGLHMETSVRTGGCPVNRSMYMVGAIRTGVNMDSIDIPTTKNVYVGTRMSEVESYTESSAYEIKSDGYTDTRNTGRQFYIRLVLNFFSQLKNRIVAEVAISGRR